MQFLGVRIDEYTRSEALDLVSTRLQRGESCRIFTPNAEMLVEAQRNPDFQRVLNTSDLSLCDSVGVSIFARGKVTRVTGVDFMNDLLALADKDEKSVYFLGSQNDSVLKKLVDRVITQYPRVRIVGFDTGPLFSIKDGAITFATDLDAQQNQEVIDTIKRTRPGMLFVAFGHGKQEVWIDTYADHIPHTSVMMGVGGSFDYLSGMTPRAPQWMRKMGFEWLYRLIREPKRFKRIITAVIIFPYYALTKNRQTS